jgi:Protein of unknown function (DUF1091)
MIYDKENETHWGALRVELFQDFPGIIARSVLADNHRTFFDLSFSFCKWINNRRVGFMLESLKTMFKETDISTFNCPIKKGKYIAKGPVPKNRVIENDLPSFVRLEKRPEERLNFPIILKAKVGKKMKHLATIIDILAWG